MAYFANTAGAILGSVLTGFLFIPFLGVQPSIALLVLINGLTAIALLVGSRMNAEGAARSRFAGMLAATALGLAILTGDNVFVRVLEDQIERRLGGGDVIYYKEGVTATVSALEVGPRKDRLLLVNSIVMTGKGLTPKLMGHLPALLHPQPRKALVVCFGIGTTFRSLAAHGLDVQGVELVPEEIETFPLFYKDARRVLDAPHHRIEINDGRNHLLLSRKTYDIITVDPSPPMYSSGTVNLLTPEFYRLCRRRLTEDGLMCMWFFLPTCRISEFQMLLKSFMTVFPHTTLWEAPEIYGVMAIGAKHPLRIDRAEMARRIGQPAVQADVREALAADAAFDAERLLSLFMFGRRRLWQMVKNGPDLTDDTPYIEHPLLTWWRDPHRLDAARFFQAPRDDVSAYVMP